MMILIKYGPENPAERWKIDAAKDEDQIVLIQNGIFWAIAEPQTLAGKKVAVLNLDLEARGYSPEACQFAKVDYAGFIELLEQNPHSMS